jgi:hypothetical protein
MDRRPGYAGSAYCPAYGGRHVMARRRRKAGLFDVVMLLILVAVVWLFLGRAGIVPPLPIGP